MRNPEIKLAYDTHCDKPVVSLNFEKDYNFYGKVKAPPHCTMECRGAQLRASTTRNHQKHYLEPESNASQQGTIKGVHTGKPWA